MKSIHILMTMVIATCNASGASPQLASVGSTISAKNGGNASALRSILLSQLRSVHNHPEWFLPLNTAVSGLTPQQAAWVPVNSEGKTNPNANHSAGTIASHILFWDADALAQLKGERTRGTATNDETFNQFDPANWSKIVRDLDAVLSALEELVEHADDSRVVQIAPMIERISTHTAYHTGQIFYVRKLQGTWKLDNDLR
jgi:hypothetical protein